MSTMLFCQRLFALTFALIIIHSSTARAELEIKVDGDSLWVGTPGDRTGVPVSLLTGNDTLRVESVNSIWLWSAQDSIMITKTSRFVSVLMALGDRSFSLVFFFDTYEYRFEERLQLLRRYSKYGVTPIPASSTFSYASAADSGLTALRERYDLDQVAGAGSDISRILNLLRWAHKVVRHDGSSFNPSPVNALNLIQVCADSNRGVNCRMMAAILNEACLSVGLKSRHLTCLPGDKNDTECHVVCMVWSDSLDKWIFVDPTFQGYFTNAQGALLSPEEIRAAYISGDSLAVGPELDYNGSVHNPLEYRYYLAKNVFRFFVPLESAFNYESRPGKSIWIHLNPTDYDLNLSSQADSTSSGGYQMIRYYTDNARWFWSR